jgi:hypothetical protein
MFIGPANSFKLIKNSGAVVLLFNINDELEHTNLKKVRIRIQKRINFT